MQAAEDPPTPRPGENIKNFFAYKIPALLKKSEPTLDFAKE